MNTGTSKTMIAFTDGSAHLNPGPIESGVTIKKQGRNSTSIKIAKAVQCMGSSYEGKLEAIKIATQYARDNFSPSNHSLPIFSDCQSAILATAFQKKEYYHNSNEREIRENLLDISPKVQTVRIVYCPPYQDIEENELACSLVKATSKETKDLQPNTQLLNYHPLKSNKEAKCSRKVNVLEGGKTQNTQNINIFSLANLIKS